MKSITHREMERKLREKGFVEQKGRGGGGHKLYKNASGKTISLPSKKHELSIPLAQRLLKEME